MHGSVKDWLEDHLAQPHLENPSERNLLHRTMTPTPSSQTTTATSAARLNYRDRVLADTYHAHFRLVVDFPDQLPRALAAALGSARRVPFYADEAEPASGQQDTTPPSAITFAQEVDWLLRSGEISSENETLWNARVWIRLYEFAKGRDLDYKIQADELWDDGYPLNARSTIKATRPKPDFVIGFRVPADVSDSPSPLSKGVLSVLSAEPGFNLQPCTRSFGEGAAFPTLVHESKQAAGAAFEAANQLARCFVWMLHQQDELRRAALKGDSQAAQDQLPVFGIATVGSSVELYSAIGTFGSGFRIVQEAHLDIQFIPDTLTLLNFVKAALKWSKEVYRPQIERWISAAHEYATSSAQARLKAFESSNRPPPA